MLFIVLEEIATKSPLPNFLCIKGTLNITIQVALEKNKVAIAGTLQCSASY